MQEVLTSHQAEEPTQITPPPLFEEKTEITPPPKAESFFNTYGGKNFEKLVNNVKIKMEELGSNDISRVIMEARLQALEDLKVKSELSEKENKDAADLIHELNNFLNAQKESKETRGQSLENQVQALEIQVSEALKKENISEDDKKKLEKDFKGLQSISKEHKNQNSLAELERIEADFRYLKNRILNLIDKINPPEKWQEVFQNPEERFEGQQEIGRKTLEFYNLIQGESPVETLPFGIEKTEVSVPPKINKEKTVISTPPSFEEATQISPPPEMSADTPTSIEAFKEDLPETETEAEVNFSKEVENFNQEIGEALAPKAETMHKDYEASEIIGVDLSRVVELNTQNIEKMLKGKSFESINPSILKDISKVFSEIIDLIKKYPDQNVDEVLISLEGEPNIDTKREGEKRFSIRYNEFAEPILDYLEYVYYRIKNLEEDSKIIEKSEFNIEKLEKLGEMERSIPELKYLKSLVNAIDVNLEVIKGEKLNEYEKSVESQENSKQSLKVCDNRAENFTEDQFLAQTAKNISNGLKDSESDTIKRFCALINHYADILQTSENDAKMLENARLILRAVTGKDEYSKQTTERILRKLSDTALSLKVDKNQELQDITAKIKADIAEREKISEDDIRQAESHLPKRPVEVVKQDDLERSELSEQKKVISYKEAQESISKKRESPTLMESKAKLESAIPKDEAEEKMKETVVSEKIESPQKKVVPFPPRKQQPTMEMKPKYSEPGKETLIQDLREELNSLEGVKNALGKNNEKILENIFDKASDPEEVVNNFKTIELLLSQIKSGLSFTNDAGERIIYQGVSIPYIRNGNIFWDIKVAKEPAQDKKKAFSKIRKIFTPKQEEDISIIGLNQKGQTDFTEKGANLIHNFEIALKNQQNQDQKMAV